MKEPRRRGVANHPDPASCASRRKDAGEGLFDGCFFIAAKPLTLAQPTPSASQKSDPDSNQRP
jgi:hypothetical protein